MELLAYIFGQTGLLNQFLGGYFFVIPLFLIGIFLIFLYVNRVSSDNIMFFILTAILLLTIDDLFQIPAQWTIAIIILILLVVGTYAYNIINR